MLFRSGETADHPHQKSAWFCHGDVIPEGLELKTKNIDFWGDEDTHKAKLKAGQMVPTGKIVVKTVGEPKQVDPSHALIETKNDWNSPEGVKIMDETRTIHLQTLPSGRLFVFDIDLHASVCPITFGDTKEGSFGVRVNDVIRLANKDGGGSTVTNSTGVKATAPAKDNLPVWGYIADWNDYSGPIDGKTAGIAVFADPKNSAKSAWHTRAYGLMAANPFGRERSAFPDTKDKKDLVKIAKGDHLKLRFGIYVHDGDAAAGKVAEAYEAFKK